MTNKEIYEWLESKGYRTSYCERSGLKIYYKKDLPAILRDFVDFSYEVQAQVAKIIGALDEAQAIHRGEKEPLDFEEEINKL
jgi:hypothetical protein